MNIARQSRHEVRRKTETDRYGWEVPDPDEPLVKWLGTRGWDWEKFQTDKRNALNGYGVISCYKEHDREFNRVNKGSLYPVKKVRRVYFAINAISKEIVKIGGYNAIGEFIGRAESSLSTKYIFPNRLSTVDFWMVYSSDKPPTGIQLRDGYLIECINIKRKLSRNKSI